MNKIAYLNKKEDELKELIENSSESEKLNNQIAQLFALRMGAVIKKPSYQEEHLWAKALYLSSKSALILINDSCNKTAIKSMKIAAEIFLNLFYESKEYDKEYCLILASICFDIAGYQANASALINILGKQYYRFDKNTENNSITKYENSVLFIIQLFLLKKLGQAKVFIEKAINYLYEDNSINYDFKVAFRTFFEGMNDLLLFLFDGYKTEYYKKIGNSSKIFLKQNHLVISHLIDLFLARCSLLEERCTWNKVDTENNIWNRYLKLLSLDLYSDNKIKKISERTSIFEFWISQLKALDEDILNYEKSFIIQMPTGAGKTFIAELTILKALTNFPNKKCVYIAPYRALTNELKDTLSKNLSKLGYIVSGVIGSYEIDETQEFWLKESNVIIATPEKIDLLLRLKPEFFDDVSLITVDEGHIIGNLDTRSALLEILIAKLKYKLDDKGIKFLFISAVMPDNNLKDFSMWLASTENNVIQCNKYIDNSPWEAAKRIIGKVSWTENIQVKNEIKRFGYTTIEYPDIKIADGAGAWATKVIQSKKYYNKKQNGEYSKIGRLFPGDEKKEITVELAFKYAMEGPVLIFEAKPDIAVSLSQSFLEMLDLKARENEFSCPEFFREDRSTESYNVACEWLGKENEITKAILRGIGVHYGDLAEPVRKAIEKDFRNRNIRVLVSTNTIGQGVNFPIKTIIINSLMFGFDNSNNKPRLLLKRDFWNIVGRAGRPGQELEGLILFPIISDFDRKLFNQYNKIANIEPVYSILYKLIKARLSEKSFQGNLEILTEASLLDLLVEEAVDTDDQTILEQLIDKTLFKVQALKETLDISPVINGAKIIKDKFYSKVTDCKTRQIYSKTGFRIVSCLKISEIIEENKDEILSYLNENNYLLLLRLICKRLNEISEMSLDDKFDETFLPKCIEEEFDKVGSFLDLWLSGAPLNEIRRNWIKIFSGTDIVNTSFMNIFIEDSFNYKYPWGVSVFIRLIFHHLNIDEELVSDEIKNISSMLKYGVSSIQAAWVRSIGINSRVQANVLAELFINSGNRIDFVNFIKWFAEIDSDYLDEFLPEISIFDKNNILQISQNLVRESNMDDYSYYTEEEFFIKGIYYHQYKKDVSKSVKIGDKLSLQRDYANDYDIYAVKIVYETEELGYVPKELARKISIAIDLYNTKFDVTVIRKQKIDDYYGIKVKLIENQE